MRQAGMSPGSLVSCASKPIDVTSNVLEPLDVTSIGLRASRRAPGAVEEGAHVTGGGNTDEPEVLPGRVQDRSRVTLLVDGMLMPGPGDDRHLGIPPDQVPPGFPVAVPQLSAPDQATDGAPDQPAHHEAPGQVEPDDRVCAGPDQLADRAVVAVHDPAIPGGGLADAADQLTFCQRAPARLVIDPVEFHLLYTEPGRESAGQGGLARPGVPDDRHAPHASQTLITEDPRIDRGSLSRDVAACATSSVSVMACASATLAELVPSRVKYQASASARVPAPWRRGASGGPRRGSSRP